MFYDTLGADPDARAFERGEGVYGVSCSGIGPTSALVDPRP